MNAAQDFITACVVATEVPPKGDGIFTDAMVPLSIQAVCEVIRNRVKDFRFPNTAIEVVLQPHQFSAVHLDQDASHDWKLGIFARTLSGLWHPDHVQRCLAEWQNPTNPSLVGGATFYYSPVSMSPSGRIPDWVSGLTEVVVPQINNLYFRFYR
jgi:hypothetical protein